MYTEKMFTNKRNMGLPLQAWVEKTIHRMETHSLSGKEKISSAVVSKEGHANKTFMKGSMTFDFLENMASYYLM